MLLLETMDAFATHAFASLPCSCPQIHIPPHNHPRTPCSKANVAVDNDLDTHAMLKTAPSEHILQPDTPNPALHAAANAVAATNRSETHAHIPQTDTVQQRSCVRSIDAPQTHPKSPTLACTTAWRKQTVCRSDAHND